MKDRIIVYYSLGGNTRRIAEWIQQEIGGDLAEIQTVRPYTGSYDDIVDQGHAEVNRGFRPEIKPLKADFNDYRQVILGSPVWWYTLAPAMNTFLESQDWAGREVYPYATNGGWIGHTFRDFERACVNARIHTGLDVKFNGSALQTPEQEIQKWILSISN